MTTKYEFYDSGGDANIDCYGANSIIMQSFTPSLAHTITKVSLYLQRVEGSNGDVVVSIKATDVDGKPTGSVLCSKALDAINIGTSYAWIDFIFSSPADLAANTKYAILITYLLGNSTRHIHWRTDATSPTYAGGSYGFSNNAGSTWTLDTSRDMMFEEYGDPPTYAPTVETLPATDVNHEQATLNGDLNNDGGLVTKVRFNYGLTPSYGINTNWQENKHTNDTFLETITSLQDEKTYHFRTEANNSKGTSYGADAEFTTLPIPNPEGQQVKVTITHPALKRVRAFFYGQEFADYNMLSDPDNERIIDCLEIPVATPCTVEVTTLADQVFTFNIPIKT